jgi:YVTN family beta-propeller protein
LSAVLSGALAGNPAYAGFEVIDTIPVGERPRDVAVNAVTNRIYVANAYSRFISVIDGDTHAVVAQIRLGQSPPGIHSLAVNALTDRIYVVLSHLYDSRVKVVDGSSNNVIATVIVEDVAGGLDVNPLTNRIYVTNFKSDSVSVIDGRSNGVIATVPVERGPHQVAVNPRTNRIYVGCILADVVLVIDGEMNSVVGSIADSGPPVTVDPTVNRIYAKGNGGGLFVIDGNTDAVLKTIPMYYADSRYVYADLLTHRLFTSHFFPDTVSVVDPEAGMTVDAVPVSRPSGLEGNFLSGRVYVTNYVDHTVTVLADPDAEPPPWLITTLENGSPGELIFPESETLVTRAKLLTMLLGGHEAFHSDAGE